MKHLSNEEKAMEEQFLVSCGGGALMVNILTVTILLTKKQNKDCKQKCIKITMK